MNEASRHILLSRERSDERMRLYRVGEKLRRRLAICFNSQLLPAPEGGQRVSERRGHTERFHRVLVTWLALQDAMAKARRQAGEDDGQRLTPWNCEDEEVSKLWEQITCPENFQALWEWLYQSASGEPEIWAQQALQECQLRSKEKD